LQFHFSFFQSQFSFSELQLLDSVLRSSNSVSMDFFLLPIDEFGKASASACESSEYHYPSTLFLSRFNSLSIRLVILASSRAFRSFCFASCLSKALISLLNSRRKSL